MILIQVTNSSGRDAKMFCMFSSIGSSFAKKRKEKEEEREKEELTELRALARRQPRGLLRNANLHHVAGQAWQRGHQSCELSHMSLRSPGCNLENQAVSTESILCIGLSWYPTICSG